MALNHILILRSAGRPGTMSRLKISDPRLKKFDWSHWISRSYDRFSSAIILHILIPQSDNELFKLSVIDSAANHMRKTTFLSALKYPIPEALASGRYGLGAVCPTAICRVLGAVHIRTQYLMWEKKNQTFSKRKPLIVMDATLIYYVKIMGLAGLFVEEWNIKTRWNLCRSGIMIWLIIRFKRNMKAHLFVNPYFCRVWTPPH